MKLKSVITIIFLLFTVNLFAQVTATGHIYAEIIEPITISKTVDMDFGVIRASENENIIELMSTGIISGKNFSSNETISNAKFTISGQPGYTYNITLPASISLNDKNLNSMIVDSFTSLPSCTGTIDNNGNSTLTIGAKLYINSNQSIGKYSSNGLIVMVN